MQRFIIYAGAVLIIFLLGFIPMWLKARAATRSLIETEHPVMLVRMQSNLASAVIDARRGDYEPARQGASQFFATLRAEIDKADISNFTPAQKTGHAAVVCRTR